MLLNLRFSIKAMMPFLMSLKGEILFLSPFKGFLIGFSQKYLIYLGIDFRASQPQLLETLRERGSQKSKVKSQKSKLRLRTTKINLGDALSVAEVGLYLFLSGQKSPQSNWQDQV